MYVFLAIVIGFGSAVLAGMFGVGGAAITTPALRVVLQVSPAIALGTTLPVTIPTALAGAVTYYRRGLVDTRAVCLCGAGGLIGSVGGALLTKVLNLHYLMLFTGAVVLYLSGVTVFQTIKRRSPDSEIAGHLQITDETSSRADISASKQMLITVGLAGGFVSGLLGVGGGILLIPAFLYLFHAPIKKAFGTSLAIITIIAVPGTIVHALLGHISWWLFMYLTIGVVPGAYLGARLSIRTREPVLYALFGVLLGAFGVVFIVNEIISMVG